MALPLAILIAPPRWVIPLTKWKILYPENYKDDAFAKGKALHQTLLKNIEDFKPVSEKYHEAIQEINDRRQLTQLKRIEEAEGKTFNYYSLAVMISAKQINKVISADTFDAEAMMKKSRNWKQ